jgi:opacity protein-like surface antigen
MKTIKSICAAAVLAISLTIPAYAEDPNPGIIHTPGKTACESGDTGTLATGEIGASDTSLDGDISFSVYAEMLWTLTAMF